MQHAATARTARRPRRRRQVAIEGEEKLVEFCRPPVGLGTRDASLLSMPRPYGQNTRRNDPCPCGSGKKYKRCCLAKDEEAQRVALAVATAVAPPSRHPSDVAAEIAERLAAAAAADDAADELWNLSNAALDLVHEGKLKEAERAARDLLERSARFRRKLDAAERALDAAFPSYSPTSHSPTAMVDMHARRNRRKPVLFGGCPAPSDAASANVWRVKLRENSHVRKDDDCGAHTGGEREDRAPRRPPAVLAHDP
jgi:hypothetical protein